MSDGPIWGELTHLDDSNSEPCPRCGERVHLSERICSVCATRAAMAAIERGDCVTVTEGEFAIKLSPDGLVDVVRSPDGA